MANDEIDPKPSPQAGMKSRREPVVIDAEAIAAAEPDPAAKDPAAEGAEAAPASLAEAEAIHTVDAAQPTPPFAEPVSPPKKPRSAAWLALPALAIGALAGTGGVGWWTQQQIENQKTQSDEQAASLAQRIDAIAKAPTPAANPGAAQIRALEERLAVVERRPVPAAAPPTSPANSPALADLEKRVGQLDARLGQIPAGASAPSAAMADLERRLAALEAAPKPATLPAGEGQSAGLPAAPQKIPDAEAAALDARFAALESRLGQIDGRVGQADSRLKDIEAAAAKPKIETRATEAPIEKTPRGPDPVALSVVMQSIAKSLERGDKFPAELAAAQGLGADPAGLAGLKAASSNGAPTARQLTAAFRSLAPAILESVQPAAGEAASVMDRLTNAASRLVRVRPVGEATGDDTPSSVARIEAALERGAISAALKDWERLPVAARKVSESWASQAKSRVDADSAAQTLISNALAEIGRKGNGP